MARQPAGLSGIFFRGTAALFLLAFLSCGASGPGCLWIDYDSFPPPEKSLLLLLTERELVKLGFVLSDKDAQNDPETITLRYSSVWGSWETMGGETEFSGGYNIGSCGAFYPLSRTCMVPRWEAGKPADDITVLDTYGSAHDCIIPLRDLAPPYRALKVGGLDISDPDYPLVHMGGMEFEYNAASQEITKQEAKRIQKRITVLAKAVMALGKRAASGPFRDTLPHFEERPALFRIAAGGDAMFARGADGILLAEGPEAVLGETAALVRTADLAILNLEGVVTDLGEAMKKSYTFRFNPAIAPVLKEAGFDAVLAANNHAFDYGMTGFLDTLDHLERANLFPLGAGRDIRTAARPFAGGTKEFPVRIFGLASYGRERTGWDGLEYAAEENRAGFLHAGKGGAELIADRIRGNRENALDLVFFHGGVEYADYPDGETRALYTELIRSGVDLVIGTHPHVEQAFEWINGKPVFWSLGDYVFNGMSDTPGGDRGIFIVLSYLVPNLEEKAGPAGIAAPNDPLLVYMDLYPLFMDGPRTVVMPKEHLERFWKLSGNAAGL